MTHPFVIWTMRRTGGTTLADLLMTLSEHPRCTHEPFNWDRAFGWVSKAWNEDADPVALRTNMKRVLHKRPNIKHCHEIHPQELNACLLEETLTRDYRHIILDRRAEADRILSLELAKQTGAWGKMGAAEKYRAFLAGEAHLDPIDLVAATRHMAHCATKRRRLAALLDQAGVTPEVVYFEEVYSDFEAGRARVERLLAFLGIDPAGHDDYTVRLETALLHRGQNSAQMLALVPGIEAARARLAEAAATHPFAWEAGPEKTGPEKPGSEKKAAKKRKPEKPDPGIPET